MTAQEFIFNTPLYQKISLDEITFWEEILREGGIYDGYNPFQKKESTFSLIKGICNYESGDFNSRLIEESGAKSMILRCGRYKDLLYIYVYFDVTQKTITKIGQYPSIADIHIGEIKQYKKVLSNEKLREFTRAIGLVANGVGVGSFVYLRRILESLIFEIAETVIEECRINRDDFEKARMDEKIDMLKSELPSFLVSNQKIYGILSAGIHELSEEECLSYFDIMRVSIELILDERLEALQKTEKTKKAAATLDIITAKIKASKP